MSFPVNFFWNAKRENSTKIPTNAQLDAGQTFNCTLLENTSVLNPTFKISISPDVNIWNEQWVNGYFYVSGGSYHESSNNTTIRSKNYIAINPNMTYYFLTSSTATLYRIAFFDMNKTYVALQSYSNSRTFTTPANAYYMKFYLQGTSNPYSYNKDVSINSPSTETTYHAYSSLMTYNYCFVSEFERFYFINDISTDKNFWYVSCTCDVLATYRDTILSGSHYVLRSASAYDEYISDSAYISKMKETGVFATGSVDGTSATDPFSYSNGHSYVWCITADVTNGTLSSQQIGSNVYYWMDDLECYTFVDYLLNVVQYSGIDQSTEYSEAMQKALINPMQFINSVILLPFSKNQALATDNYVQFGYYGVTLAAPPGQPDPTVKRLTQGTMMKTQVLEITLPKHPQAATRGKYMNGAPYTSYELFLGAFGTIPIDPAPLIDETTLQVTCQTECCTGLTRILVRGKTSNSMIYTGTAQVGVPVTVSQLTRDMLGEVQNNLNMSWSTAGAMAGIVTGGIGATGSTFNAVQSIGAMAFDAVRMKYPTVTGGGSNSSFLSLHSTCYLNAKYYEIVGANNTEIGRPLYQTKTLSTLSGFTVCSGADVAITGTADEAEKINGYLNSGFFIE